MIGSMLGYWLLFLGWRWLFYFLTIIATLNLIFLYTCTQETYAPYVVLTNLQTLRPK